MKDFLLAYDLDTVDGFEKVLARHEKSIIDSYQLTQTEDEIWVTEQLSVLYDEIYKEGPLLYEIEEFDNEGNCQIRYCR